MTSVRTALALALVVISFLGCASEDPAALLASARQYMEQRDYKASVIQLKNVLQKAPENAEARYLLGLAFLEQGDALGAEIELGKAADHGFSSDELHTALARALLAKGEAAKVVERYESKTVSSPETQAELRALVGMARLQQKQPEEARRAFDQALALDASNVSASLGAARLAAAGQDYPQALVLVERALATAPTRLEVLLFKADVLAAQARPAEAEKAYRAGMQAAPGLVAPRLSLIVHLLREGALERAAAEAAAMDEAAPKDPRTLYARALVLLEQKKFLEAKEAIVQVLKVTPGHVPSLTLAGMAALNSGALPEAESHLRKAVFNAPQAVGAKRLLAMTHLRMGKTELALAELGELLKVSDDPAIVALAGEAHLASGDIAGAARHYERAKSLAPRNSALQTRLALIRLAAGDAERAISELESASAGDTQAYQADLALVTNYLRRREADKALAAVDALEKKQPLNPLTHNLRGGALLLKRDFAGARASFERALELQPGYMAAVSNLAQLDVRERKPQAAKQRYEAILKAEPNNEQALLGLAVLLRVTGAEAEEIEKPLRRSVAANPASATARLALINFHLRSRDFKAALAAAQEAQAALPASAAVLQALGTAQLAAGDTRQAIASLMRLAEMLPKAVEPHLLLARAHMAEKQADEAIRSLRAALAIRPDLPSAQRDIAAIYVSTRRHDEALREAKAVQAQKPKEAIGHVLEGEIYLAQKKLDLAERSYRAALKKFDLPALLMRTHSILEAAGKRAEADALAEDWIERHPGDAGVLGYLGERDILARRYERAAARYREALERQPENALFLNNLAWVASALKRPEALEYAERAHELAPHSAAIMDTLGTILAGSGQTERGLELLARAAELSPEAHQIRLNFAKALIQAERKAAARKELEPLARLDPGQRIQQEAAKLLEGL